MKEEIFIQEDEISLTPSIVMEYLFCPAYFYFYKVLDIAQHEEKRYKVVTGREIHKKKASQNTEYLRIKLGVKKKIIEQKLYSNIYCFHGILDEILFLQDDKASSLDYKFAEYHDKVFRTHKIQAVMYAMLIEENYSTKVEKCYLVYTRSKNKLVEISILEKDKKMIVEILEEIKNIILKGYFPNATKEKNKCIDCCYKNICVFSY